MGAATKTLNRERPSFDDVEAWGTWNPVVRLVELYPQFAEQDVYKEAQEEERRLAEG